MMPGKPMSGQPRPRPIPGVRPPQAAPPPPPKKGGKGFLIGVIAIFALIMVAGITAFVFLFVMADDRKSESSTHSPGDDSDDTFEVRLQAAAQATSLVRPTIDGPLFPDGVDEDGVTHFGNPQFAPPANSEKITVQDANGMDVPDASGIARSRSNHRPYVYIRKSAKKNKRGWRGFRSQRQRNQGYRG